MFLYILYIYVRVGKVQCAMKTLMNVKVTIYVLTNPIPTVTTQMEVSHVVVTLASRITKTNVKVCLNLSV